MTTIDEATNLSSEDRELLAEVKSVIQRLLPTATVLLYGSVARGTQHAESDYDVLILTDEILTSGQESVIRRAVLDLELDCGSVITLLFHTKAEWDSPLHRVMPFHQEVEREAIAL